jgi:hypothetical protein
MSWLGKFCAELRDGSECQCGGVLELPLPAPPPDPRQIHNVIFDPIEHHCVHCGVRVPPVCGEEGEESPLWSEEVYATAESVRAATVTYLQEVVSAHAADPLHFVLPFFHRLGVLAAIAKEATVRGALWVALRAYSQALVEAGVWEVATDWHGEEYRRAQRRADAEEDRQKGRTVRSAEDPSVLPLADWPDSCVAFVGTVQRDPLLFRAIRGRKGDRANASRFAATLHSNRSLVRLRVDDERGAFGDAMVAVNGRPSWAKGWYRLGQVLTRKENYTVAVEAFEAAAKIRPFDSDVRTALADARGKLRVKEELAQTKRAERFEKQMEERQRLLQPDVVAEKLKRAEEDEVRACPFRPSNDLLQSWTSRAWAPDSPEAAMCHTLTAYCRYIGLARAAQQIRVRLRDPVARDAVRRGVESLDGTGRRVLVVNCLGGYVCRALATSGKVAAIFCGETRRGPLRMCEALVAAAGVGHLVSRRTPDSTPFAADAAFVGHVLPGLSHPLPLPDTRGVDASAIRDLLPARTVRLRAVLVEVPLDGPSGTCFTPFAWSLHAQATVSPLALSALRRLSDAQDVAHVPLWVENDGSADAPRRISLRSVPALAPDVGISSRSTVVTTTICANGDGVARGLLLYSDYSGDPAFQWLDPLAVTTGQRVVLDLHLLEGGARVVAVAPGTAATRASPEYSTAMSLSSVLRYTRLPMVPAEVTADAVARAVRTAKLRARATRHIVVTLDVGSGVGEVARVADEAGSDLVYAIERRAGVPRLPPSPSVTQVTKDMRRVALLREVPHAASVIHLGVDLGTGAPSGLLAHARRERMLTRGATVVPRAMRVEATLVCDVPPGCANGAVYFDIVVPGDAEELDEATVAARMSVMSEPFIAFDLDFAAQGVEIEREEKDIRVPIVDVASSGCDHVTGIVYWYTIDVDDSVVGLTVPRRYFLPLPPLQVAGDEPTAVLRLTRGPEGALFTLDPSNNPSIVPSFAVAEKDVLGIQSEVGALSRQLDTHLATPTSFARLKEVATRMSVSPFSFGIDPSIIVEFAQQDVWNTR